MADIEKYRQYIEEIIHWPGRYWLSSVWFGCQTRFRPPTRPLFIDGKRL